MVRAAGQRRRRIPLVIVVVASLLGFLAILGVWANRQFLDNDGWAATSSALLKDDAVRDQVSALLVDELYVSVDVEADVAKALPPRAGSLAAPAAAALRELAERTADRLLGRPRVQALWEEANREAHASLIKAVTGGGEVVSTEHGDVVLDLRELLEELQQRVGLGGRAAGELPEDAAEVTILRSDQLELAQDAVAFFEALVEVLVVLALLLYALAVYLARGWRREALRACGIGFIAVGAASLLSRSLAGAELEDSVASTEAVRPAIAATWTIATSLLEEAAHAMIGYGVAIVTAAWLAGPSSRAAAVRRALAPFLREPHIAYGALAAAVLLLLAWNPTPATEHVLPVLFFVGLLLAGLELLRRQTARE